MHKNMVEETDILKFTGVNLQDVPHEQSEMRGLTFLLESGSLMVLTVEAGHENLPLADAAEGLIVPAAGAVCWRNRAWSAMQPGEELSARSRIGRVFEKDGWISNLNVIENITLAQRHHTARPEKEIIAEADELARSFGLREAPRQRPAFVPRRELRLAEWIRAFMGNPLLLLLERPETGVMEENVPRLIKAVREARSRGAAVIWQTDRDSIRQTPQLESAVRYRMRGKEMILSEDKQP